MSELNKDNNSLGPWLTRQGAAKYLGVCESTIYNLESVGTLKAYRINSYSKRPIVRFRKQDLDELLMTRQRGRPRQETT